MDNYLYTHSMINFGKIYISLQLKICYHFRLKHNITSDFNTFQKTHTPPLTIRRFFSGISPMLKCNNEMSSLVC